MDLETGGKQMVFTFIAAFCGAIIGGWLWSEVRGFYEGRDDE